MQGFLNALITFASNGDRNRASSAIQTWVTNYNAAHPSAVFVGQTTSTTYNYPADDENHPGVAARALSVAYVCSDFQGVVDAMAAIATDVNANSYWDIVNLSTWET